METLSLFVAEAETLAKVVKPKLSKHERPSKASDVNISITGRLGRYIVERLKERCTLLVCILGGCQNPVAVGK